MTKPKSLDKNIIARIPEVEGVFKLHTFARKCRVDVNTISKILKGYTKDPGVYTIAKIADVFDCSVDDLVSDSVQDDDRIKLKVNLVRSCITKVVDLLIKKKYKMALDDFLAVLEEIYLHSLNINAKVVDVKFAETCINNFFER